MTPNSPYRSNRVFLWILALCAVLLSNTPRPLIAPAPSSDRAPTGYRTHADERFLAQVARELSKEGKMAPNTEELSQIVREMVAVVPWWHHANALAKVTDPAARLHYLRAAALPERGGS
jgi:hypothetical protein